MLWRKFHLNWRYALGEFAIVVLGVLAALGVDNWNSDRKDRLLEIEYIAAILEDLRKDDAAMQFAMQEAETNSNLGRILLKAMDEETVNIAASEFVTAAARSPWLHIPTHTRVTINDLMSTGNLRLIRSNAIRASISTYYTDVEQRGVEQVLREHQSRMGRLIAEFLPLEFREAHLYELSGGPPWAPKSITATDSDTRAILEAMLANPNVRPAIEIMIRTQGIEYVRQGAIRDRLYKLIAELEAYQRKLAT
jgi:hypothetical protein